MSTTQPTKSTTTRKPRENARRATQPASSPNQTQVTVLAGPDAVLDRHGRVLPVRANAYPEVVAGEGITLRCLGCRKDVAASRFQHHGSKGDGKGRYVECTPCFEARLAENKRRRAAGEETIPAPRAKVVPARAKA